MRCYCGEDDSYYDMDGDLRCRECGSVLDRCSQYYVINGVKYQVGTNNLYTDKKNKIKK